MNQEYLLGKQIDSHKSWADILRVFCIFGVIVIHACGSTIYSYGKISSIDWLEGNLLDSFVRCSVPLFVMLSGALIIRLKVSSVHEVFKRILKVLIPLMIWDFFFLLYVSHFSGSPLKLQSIFINPPMYHLWFVYMIIGLYLILPLFQMLFLSLIHRKEMQIYLFFVWFVISSLPIYMSTSCIANYQQLNLFQQINVFGYGGYFMIGAFLADQCKQSKLPSYKFFIIFLAGVAATFLYTLYFSQVCNGLIETAYLYLSPNVILSSIALFIVFNGLSVKYWVANYFKWVADKVFLIYFIHVVILEHVSNSHLIASIKQTLPVFFVILIVSLLTFVISLAFASALRLLPKSKFYIG